MRTKYIKVRLGEPNEDKEIFVREKDFDEMQKALRSKKPNKVVKAVLQVLLGSPDGMNDLAKGINAFSFLQSCNQINILENYKDLINYEIRKLKHKQKCRKGKK
jgi:hypothetical protein